nr:RNA polymerase pre-readthrough protein [Cucumber Bulgarian latent virus]
MDAIKRLFGKNQQIFVGQRAIGVETGPKIDMFSLICKVVLRYMQTGKIEHKVDGLSGFVVELLKTDAAAKWDWFMRRARRTDYVGAVSCLSAIAILPLWCAKRWYSRLAVGMLLTPVCVAAAYATLPREKLSTYRLRSEAREHMEDEKEATECLVVEEARQLKGKDGEDIITGSRLTRVVAKTGRPGRRPYAAKIAQVARAKVGYLKNTPENRLIYQRVLIEIMDKDCVRYCDRDGVLPLAIGCCFVYPEGTEEASQLWGSQESLGVK